MSHLSDIGFGFQGPGDFYAFVETIVNETTNRVYPTDNGFYVVWTPGAGVELWIQAGKNLQLTGVGLHFTGEGRLRVHVTQSSPSEIDPMHGCLYAWANPQDEDNPYSGDYPLMVAAPNFDFVENAVLEHPVVDCQIAAFVEDELRCWTLPTFLSTGQAEEDIALFQSDCQNADAAEEPTPHAQVRGTVLKLETRVNQVSGNEFYWAVVQTVGGTIDIVADPAVVVGTLVEGGIVEARCWLSALVLTGVPVESVPITPVESAFRNKRLARARNRSNKVQEP